jgi:hypothetical protein
MKKGLTHTKIEECLNANNLNTLEDIMNNISKIYDEIMVLHNELGLTGLTSNEFERWVQHGYQQALLQDAMNKHFKGVFNGNH